MVEDSYSTRITPDEDADAAAPKVAPKPAPSAPRRALGSYSSGGAAGAMVFWSDSNGEDDPAS